MGVTQGMRWPLRGIGSTSMDLEASSRGCLHRLVPASRLTSPTLEGDCFLNRCQLDRGKPCQPRLTRESCKKRRFSLEKSHWHVTGSRSGFKTPDENVIKRETMVFYIHSRLKIFAHLSFLTLPRPKF